MSSASSAARPSPADEPRLDFVACASPAGLHRMAYWEWGDPDNDRVLVCVHGLTRTGRDFDPLARALGPRGIAVTSVAPGFTDTDMAAEALAGVERERREAESPLGRIATAEEVAAAIVYLASPEAELASGSVLDVNGASYLRM